MIDYSKKRKRNSSEEIIETPETIPFSALGQTTNSSNHDGKVSLKNDPDIRNKEYVPTASPDETDEQSFAGSASDPDASNDTLKNAQMMGQQVDEDSENPKEIDIARDISKSEEYAHQ